MYKKLVLLSLLSVSSNTILGSLMVSHLPTITTAARLLPIARQLVAKRTFSQTRPILKQENPYKLLYERRNDLGPFLRGQLIQYIAKENNITLGQAIHLVDWEIKNKIGMRFVIFKQVTLANYLTSAKYWYYQLLPFLQPHDTMYTDKRLKMEEEWSRFRYGTFEIPINLFTKEYHPFGGRLKNGNFFMENFYGEKRRFDGGKVNPEDIWFENGRSDNDNKKDFSNKKTTSTSDSITRDALQKDIVDNPTNYFSFTTEGNSSNTFNNFSHTLKSYCRNLSDEDIIEILQFATTKHYNTIVKKLHPDTKTGSHVAFQNFTSLRDYLKK